MDGLKTLDDLQSYLIENPRGYFFADAWRFERNQGPILGGDLDEDIAWVQTNMIRIEEASNEDITVYAWGLDRE